VRWLAATPVGWRFRQLSRTASDPHTCHHQTSNHPSTYPHRLTRPRCPRRIFRRTLQVRPTTAALCQVTGRPRL